MTKPDGRVFIGLQRHVQSGDVSRDLAVALLCALDTPTGQTVNIPALPGVGPAPAGRARQRAAGHHRAHAGSSSGSRRTRPTTRTCGRRWSGPTPASSRRSGCRRAPATYWCRVTDRSHVRWVLGDDEDRALDALSRLSAGGGLLLGDNTKFAGMFRAHGLLAPVWDLPLERRRRRSGRRRSPSSPKRYAEALAVERAPDRRRAPQQAGPDRPPPSDRSA